MSKLDRRKYISLPRPVRNGEWVADWRHGRRLREATRRALRATPRTAPEEERKQ